MTRLQAGPAGISIEWGFGHILKVFWNVLHTCEMSVYQKIITGHEPSLTGYSASPSLDSSLLSWPILPMKTKNSPSPLNLDRRPIKILEKSNSNHSVIAGGMISLVNHVFLFVITFSAVFGDDSFSYYDRNRDGKVEYVELAVAKKTDEFDKMDRNRDKLLTSKEFASVPVEKKGDSNFFVTPHFANLDADSDGAVTLKEFGTAIKALIQHIDSSGDNSVTAEEYAAAINRRKTETAATIPLLASETYSTETISGAGAWIDPAIEEFNGNEFRITVWLEKQFLGNGKSYLQRTEEFGSIGRIAMRERVIATLKALSEESAETLQRELDRLLTDQKISELQFHWIVNGFSCRTTRAGLEEIKSIDSVRMIYFGGMDLNHRKPTGTSFKPEDQPNQLPPFNPKRYDSQWYIEALKVDEVWRKHKIMGDGVLNVVHDGNFILSPGIVDNLYRNPKELANGKDDSGNGLNDDIHGYDFQLDRPTLTRTPMPRTNSFDPGLLHGHQCAAIICGRGTKESPHQFGIAPESKWAGVLAGRSVEAAIEWAIEQGADTYSMSFSIPKLGEFRSHWRKMMEHGTYCGVHFVSGAGNFAIKGRPNFAPVPVQMRTPEDIPHVVFAAAGVKRDLNRTPFSSQGPVKWETEHYRDGLVDKPEVAAFNFQLPRLLPNGKVQPMSTNGNSLAGPMFCGTIALMLSANPELKPWEVREIIIATARDVGPSGYDHQTGHGLIDAYAAVTEAIKRRKQN